MTSREEIQATFNDCECAVIVYAFSLMLNALEDQLGQNGFEKAHTWKSKIGGR